MLESNHPTNSVIPIIMNIVSLVQEGVKVQNPRKELLEDLNLIAEEFTAVGLKRLHYNFNRMSLSLRTYINNQRSLLDTFKLWENEAKKEVS